MNEISKETLFMIVFFYKRFGLRKLLTENEDYLNVWVNRITVSLHDKKPTLAFDSESIEVFYELLNELGGC